MTGRRILPLLLCLCLLTGCSSLLEREYSTVEPHSSKFWESEAAGTLRAENYQDIVNDLLILIGQHTDSATVRLYNYQDEMTVADTLEMAAAEIQQETPMGAYAVEYITSSTQSQRGYYEISIQIGNRSVGSSFLHYGSPNDGTCGIAHFSGYLVALLLNSLGTWFRCCIHLLETSRHPKGECSAKQ